MDLTKQARRTVLICVALGAATLAVFWPVTSSDFVNYDDPVYVGLNLHVMDGLHWKNVVWAFQPGFSGNWHPLTWISHMLDVQLFGLNPGWHHLVSLLLHVASTLLLFLLFQRLTGAAWRSASVAALFALHPLHVESVAWVSERKDVLSAFFFMLTLWAYVRYVNDEWRTTKDEGNPKAEIQNARGTVRTTDHASRFYGLSLAFFALGLMSKPMLVTVPFVLLLLDYWPLGRMQNAEGRRQKAEGVSSSFILPHSSFILLEKLPFFLLSAFSCVVTFRAQSWGGAVRPLALLSVDQRVSNAIVGYATYLKQTFWPAGLAVFYPLSEQVSSAALLAAGALLLGITAWAVAPLLSGTRSAASPATTGTGTRWNASLREPSRPWRVMGWFWFLGMLVPVIGLVQVGMQQTADRYTYLPLIGLFVMVVWEVSERVGQIQGDRNHIVLAAGALAGLLGCAVLTRSQLGYWQDSERLFRHALAVTRDNWLAHDCLGHAVLAQGKEDEAISEYEAAVALQPRPEIRFSLGTTLSKRHRYEEAAAQFSEMLRATPENVPVLVQLGLARAQQGRTEDALQALSEAVRIDPTDVGAHNNLGNILMQKGRLREAVKQFEEAVRLDPRHAGAHNNLAISYKKLGHINEAIAHYREALRLEPESLQALNNLAWTLAAYPKAQYRDGAEAVRLATKACELTRYQSPIPLATLAAAYAERGKFEEAISFSERARDLPQAGQGAPAATLAAMLEAFRAGRPYYAE
jgi:tetratricopeptide (TPR) repeat protein